MSSESFRSKRRDVVVGIDIGGTFTDTVVVNEEGEISTYKSFSTPDRLIDGFLDNVRLAAQIDGLEVAEFLPAVSRIAHGTTVATNAFIERRGGNVALLTTRGFEDTLVAQRMMGMTAGLSPGDMRDYAKRSVPPRLVENDLVFGIRERVDYAGREVARLFEEDVHDALEKMILLGVESVAVCYLWSVRNPAHEIRTAEIICQAVDSMHISLSHEIAPRIGEYERMTTTVVNAYLSPTVSSYTSKLVDNIELETRGQSPPIYLLDSIGGVLNPAEASREPVRLLISGPSGGMTASEQLAKILGHANIITFDMGGTSCDVGMMVDGEVIKKTDTTVGKYHLVLPKIDIHVIGSGGGSIAKVIGNRYLQVGPESAGSVPGPACYCRGGEQPTVTDADVVLGIINPDNFLGGRVKLDRGFAVKAIEEHVAKPLAMDVEQAAAGIKQIVDNQMYDLLRTVTIDRGRDPREFVLYAYGGAGASHAPSFAFDLVPEIVIPSTHSVHSALGAVASDAHAMVSKSEILQINDQSEPGIYESIAREIGKIVNQLLLVAKDKLVEQGIADDKHAFDIVIDVRYHRQPKELPVRLPSKKIDIEFVHDVLEKFRKTYAECYGEESVPHGVGIELVNFSVEAKGRLSRPDLKSRKKLNGQKRRIENQRRVYDATLESFVSANIFRGEMLGPGDRITGPAILEYVDTTVNIASGQIATIDEYMNVRIRLENDL